MRPFTIYSYAVYSYRGFKFNELASYVVSYPQFLMKCFAVVQILMGTNFTNSLECVKILPFKVVFSNIASYLHVRLMQFVKILLVNLFLIPPTT